MGLASLTGTGLVFAQAPLAVGPLALVAAVPWLFALRHASGTLAALSGLVAGTVHGCGLGLWIPEALGALGSSWSGGLAGLVAAALWAKGIPFAVLGWAIRVGRRDLSAGPRVLTTCAIAAIGFALVDWLHASGSLGLPWGLLGHSQSSWLGVAQLAAVGGVPLISGLVAAINAAVASLLDPEERPVALPIVGGLLAGLGVLALAGLPLARWAHGDVSPGPERRLLLIQPTVSYPSLWIPDIQRSNLLRVRALTERALSELDELPDTIVWPETTLTTPLARDAALREDLLGAVDQYGVPLILGAIDEAAGGRTDRYRNAVIWLAPGRGEIARMEKTRGVPVVESSRTRGSLGWLHGLFGGAALGRQVEEAGEEHALSGDFPLTVVLCWEAVFPGLVDARRPAESVAILNLANDAWITSDWASRQQIAFSRFRAIEQRLSYVRVAHGGTSVVMDPFGRVESSLPRGSPGFIVARVRAGPSPSVAEKIAIAGPPVLVGTLVAGLLFRFRIGAKD